ncbi:MAG: hypothetical protein ACJ752_10940 [Gaiellaceae bacterium]
MTELELELRDLAVHLDVPPAPLLAGAVRARIARPRRHGRVLAIALAIGIFALAVAFAVPSSRASLLRFFHVRGAALTIVDKLPRLTPRAPLGTPVRMDAPPFRLLLPNGRRPEQVYAGDGGYWLRYRGLLLFEFESVDGATLIKKAALGRTDVEYVDVRGEPAIWIGSRHAVYLPGGPPRAAGHVLIWQHGPLTLRLEASVGREQALAIARRIR